MSSADPRPWAADEQVHEARGLLSHLTRDASVTSEGILPHARCDSLGDIAGDAPSPERSGLLARKGRPERLFEGPYEISEIPEARAANYDVAADGRFVMIRREEASSPREITVVLNWVEELKRLAPLDR